MIPGNITQPFMTNLKALRTSDATGHIIKIIIPYRESKKAIKKLYSMDISRTNLFPGLDGYAQSLKVWSPVFQPVNWKRYRNS